MLPCFQGARQHVHLNVVAAAPLHLLTNLPGQRLQQPRLLTLGGSDSGFCYVRLHPWPCLLPPTHDVAPLGKHIRQLNHRALQLQTYLNVAPSASRLLPANFLQNLQRARLLTFAGFGCGFCCVFWHPWPCCSLILAVIPLCRHMRPRHQLVLQHVRLNDVPPAPYPLPNQHVQLAWLLTVGDSGCGFCCGRHAPSLQAHPHKVAPSRVGGS
mmetsp:Transcript_26849/g.52545  ORF Transcript_26849/g.52545 Transcript_26849/m.52545 type:complete len:212 (+) Transcript_26849:1599-2234(+)